MSSGDKLQFEPFSNVLAIPLNMLQRFGFTRKKDLHYRIKFFISVILFLTISIGELFNLLLNKPSLEELPSFTFLLLTHLVQILKFFYTVKYRKRIIKLVDKIDIQIFEPKSSKQAKELRFAIVLSHYLSLVGLVACGGAIFFTSLFPLAIKDKRIMPTKTCFDTEKSPMYEIYYLYQVGALTAGGMTNASWDLLVSAFLFLTLTISEVCNTIINPPSIDEFAAAIFIMLTHVVQFIKCFQLIRHAARLAELRKKTEISEFQPANVNQLNILKKWISTNKYLCMLGYYASTMCCILLSIFPMAEKEERILPVIAWYPVDTKSSPAYEIIYVYQVVALTLSCVVNASIDLMISGFLMVVACQLANLNDSLKNIRELAENEMNFTGSQSEEMSHELQKLVDKKFVECIIQHWNILEFANEITYIFSKSILGQFLVSVVIICTTLFELTIIPLYSLQFVSLIFYLFCMLMEIFIWCYFGNEITVQSSKLTSYAYQGDWRNCSKKYKQNLIIFMTRSQVVLKLYAGGFFTLSLDTFVNIVKSSYSYFAVLTQVADE